MEYQPYDPQHMLTLLMDGELTSEQSRVVFQHLSVDDELQSSFHQQMRISRSVQRDVAQNTVPEFNAAAALARVQAELGVNGAASLTTLAATESSMSVAMFLPKFLSLLSAACIASVLTFVVTRAMYDQSTTSLAGPHSVLAQSDAIQHERPSTHISSVGAGQQQVPNGSFKTHQYVRFSEAHVTKSSRDETPIDLGTDTPTRQLISMAELNLSHETSTPAREEFRQAELPLAALQCNSELVSISVRRLAGLGSNNTPGFVPSPRSGSANLALSMGMSVGYGQEAGIELGQQEILNVDRASEEGTLRSASITYAGMYYRYAFQSLGLMHRLLPYTQVLVGASQLGVVAKTSLGLDYQLVEQASVVVGVESTIASYYLDGHPQSVSTSNLFAGLAIHF